MKPILKWQRAQLAKELLLLQGHASDPSCPCATEGEMCVRKHLLTLEALAQETATIEDDRSLASELLDLSQEAQELRELEEQHLCGETVEFPKPLDTWARDWRKRFEAPACDLKAEQLLPLTCQLSSSQEPRWCSGVRVVNKELARASRTLGITKSKLTELQRRLEMPLNICRGQKEMFAQASPRIDPYGSRCRDPQTGFWVNSDECGFAPETGVSNITFAMGAQGLTRYEFRFKIIDISKVVVSHDPMTYEPNPNYPGELQPRLRGRAATRIQVEKIAKNLDPDSLITDFHVLDRGAPVVGPDNVVESGNGRVMGIMLATTEFPENYTTYKETLLARAGGLGLRSKDVEKVQTPILVRERISDVDRVAFTQEANTAVSIAPSAVEQARTDAPKITVDILEQLHIGEEMSLEDALRLTRNQPVLRRFLGKLPETEQARLVDAQGLLNQDGIRRTTMAVFASVFIGDAGLRLAEIAFESMDMEIRNLISAISRSLGPLAQAENLIRAGHRRSELSIGDDLAMVANTFASIRRTPELTVDKYIAQSQMFERELTPFQEEVLIFVGKNSRSSKRMAAAFRAYAESVIETPPPAQVALIPAEVQTKEELWQQAVSASEREAAPVLFQLCGAAGDNGSEKEEVNWSLKEVGKMEQDPILSTIASQICTAGLCKANPGSWCKTKTDHKRGYAKTDGSLMTCVAGIALSRDETGMAKKLDRCYEKLRPRQEAGEIVSAAAVCRATIREAHGLPSLSSGAALEEKVTSTAGFPFDPREEKEGDTDRFFSWTGTASGKELLDELCERADYLGAHLCLDPEADCLYRGNEAVYTELSRLRFLCWKLTDKLPSSVQVLDIA